MNLTFWGLMLVMLLLAIGMLVYPLLKVRERSALAYKESNITINNEKIKELDIDLQEGRIEQQHYKVAREELDRELLVDIPVESKETASLHYTNTVKRHPALALMITIFIPLAAFLLYLDMGMHAASDDAFTEKQQRLAQQQEPMQQLSIEEMARQLEERIVEKGGTAEDWAMLARAHKYQGKNELAAKAYTVALENDANNAQLMLENAEVIALMHERNFTPESRALVLKAYSLEPDNANVLWFIGVAEFQEGNHRRAIEHLTKLLPLARGDKNVAKSVISIVAKARTALIAEGETMAELADLLGVQAVAPEKPVVAKADASNSGSSSISATRLQVTVNIEQNVKQKFNADDVVFVYAKAKKGPRMPLAAQRLTLAALPITVTLDDSMAMVDGMNISAFDQLVISARVTKSASAIAKSGDYIGQAELEVKNQGTVTKLNLIIDTMIP